MGTANKVQFGLKNVHFFPLTGADTYGAAVAIPGGVNINLAARGESTEFYADNVVYYASVANNGYEGDLELAKITDDGTMTARKVGESVAVATTPDMRRAIFAV